MIKATKDQMADHLHELIRLVEQEILCDIRPIIYCSPAYWNSVLNWEKYDFSVNPLWIAN